MAKKAGVNKSQAIRDALAENPRKPPREIAEILASKGVKVSAQYVSIVKSNAKGKKKRKTARVPKPGKRSSLGSLGAAVDFIRAAGGLQQAKSALAAVEAIKRL
jgi:hypothetical protein